METTLITILVAFAILFVIFLLLREFSAWYWKINEIIKLLGKLTQRQDDIAKLLIDVRDNTKIYQPNVQDVPEVIKCPHCAATMKLTLQDRQAKKFNCPKCSKEIVL